MDTPTGDKPTLVDNYHTLVTLMNTTFKEVVGFWDGCVTFDEDHHVVDFAIDDVKWYESYPDVAAFMNLLNEVEDLGYEYEFIRVGEDNNDIEMKETNNHNGYLNVSTHINCNL
jgi:hypothetical protein